MARADLGQVTAQEGGASSGLAVCLPFQQQGCHGPGRGLGGGRSRWQSLMAACPGSSSTGKGSPGAPRQEHGHSVCVGLSPSCSILWPGCSLSWLPGPAQLSSFCCSVGPRGARPCTHNWGVIPVGLCPLCPLVGAFLEFWHHTGKCPWLSSHLPQSSVGLCQAAKGGTGL